jgi:hypothetical protein
MDKTTMMMTTNHVSTVNDKSTMVSMTTEQSSMTTGQSSATVVSMATEQTKMTTGQSNTTMIPMTTEHSNMTMVPVSQQTMTMVPVSQQTMTMPPDVTTKGMMTSHKTNPTPKHTTQSPPTTTKKAKFQGGVFVGGIFLGIGLIVIIAGLIYFLRFRNRSYSKVN